MQIDRKVGLIIGGVVSGLVATVAGVSVYKRAKKNHDDGFKEKKSVPPNGKLRTIVVHKGTVVGEEKKAAPPAPKAFTFYKVEDEEEVLEPDEVHQDDVVEVLSAPEDAKCGRCGNPLDLNKICSGANYTLFCSPTPTFDFLKPKEVQSGEEEKK